MNGINPNELVLSPERAAVGAPWKLFVFSLIFLGAVIGSYAGLIFGYRPYLNSRIEAVQAQIDDLATSVSAEEQADLLRFYSQIVNLKTLLDSHVTFSKFFPFLERRTNNRVSFDVMFVNSATRELVLEGVAENFSILSEELQSLHQAPEIADYTLNQSQLADGRVRFRISAEIPPALFKY
jgi:hypothetical protein